MVWLVWWIVLPLLTTGAFLYFAVLQEHGASVEAALVLFGALCFATLIVGIVYEFRIYFALAEAFGYIK